MPLEVQPVVLSDFDTMEKYVYHVEGDTISPILDHSWPAETDAEAARRNVWSQEQQRRIFKEDPSVRYMKAVDTDNNDEILCLARWHFYENGWPEKDLPLELNGSAADALETWPEGLNAQMHKFIVEDILLKRPSTFGTESQWILCSIKTRGSMRKRGAAGLLVAWGVEKAKADGVPAYLEAAADAVSLYRAKGFVDLCPVENVDFNKVGVPMLMPLQRMVANRS